MDFAKDLFDLSNYFELETAQEFFTLYVMKFFAALFIIIFGRLFIRFILYTLLKLVRKTIKDETLVGFIENLLSISLQIFLWVAALHALGIETTSILAMVGAAGLAIGLALQGLLSSFASGVLMIFLQYMKKGDLVEAAGVKGIVGEIRMFSTIIVTEENKKVIVPNNKITADKITIYSDS